VDIRTASLWQPRRPDDVVAAPTSLAKRGIGHVYAGTAPSRVALAWTCSSGRHSARYPELAAPLS